jgi:hypothetical protein
MDKIVQPTNPVVGVGYGNLATLDLSIGPRYHVIWLEIIATAAVGKTLLARNPAGTANTGTLADILGVINVKVNGKTQRSFQATELDQINYSYHTDCGAQAYNYDTGVLNWSAGALQAPQSGKQTIFLVPIFLAEPWRTSYAAQELFAWYTSWADGSTLRSFQLEINIPAASANILAASAITINAYAETDTAVGPLDSNKQPIALITKWNRLQVPYSGAGDLYTTNLSKRDLYLQISIFSQSGDDISRVQVRVDSRTIRDVTYVRNLVTQFARQLNPTGYVESRVDVMFDYSDIPTDGLVMQAGNANVKDFQVISTLAAANAANKLLTFISQTYGSID